MTTQPRPPSRTPFPPPRPGEPVRVLPFDEAIVVPRPSPTSPGPAAPSEQRSLADLLDADGTGVASVDADGTVRSANGAFCSIVGAHDLADLRPGTAPSGVVRSLLDHLPNELLHGVGGGTWHGDLDHPAHGASATRARVLRSTIVVEPCAPSRPGPARVTMLLHDVTDARQQLAAIRHAASHDPLTGLADREHILGQLATAIARQRQHAGDVAVLFVDLDHLKYVNDAFGHRAGDQLLRATATRLQHAVRPDDRVARIGGDEFLVVGSDIGDSDAAMELAERVRRALSGHLRIGDLDLEFSVSIGVAVTDDALLERSDDDAATLLVSHADSAMYSAKQSGRGRSMLSTPQMRSVTRSRTELAATLARAVTDGSLHVHYQPVFSTVTRRAVAAEALVRWNHPELGRMDPASFIEIAEESGTIGRLGEQVLGRALDDLARWRGAGVVDRTFAVHVNVSRVQLGSSAFVNAVVAQLADRGLAPDQLVLEARETSLLARATDVDRSIRALRRAGVQVAVDNFGTGPKALAVMTDIGADVLKLDGSLALPTGASETDTRLVRAVVLLAHALDMDVVAERVATVDQLERLRAAGCDMVQGNLLGLPADADAIDLAARPW
ncbi:MAG: EAL domain-containing protein [Actinomycetota bacterium]